MTWTIAAALFFAAVAILVAFGEGHRRGRNAHPDVQRWSLACDLALERVAELKGYVATFNAEAEARETAAYERGRLDQAEVEAHQRSQRAIAGAKTRRDRRVNRVTGEKRTPLTLDDSPPRYDAGEGLEEVP